MNLNGVLTGQSFTEVYTLKGLKYIHKHHVSIFRQASELFTKVIVFHVYRQTPSRQQACMKNYLVQVAPPPPPGHLATPITAICTNTIKGGNDEVTAPVTTDYGRRAGHRDARWNCSRYWNSSPNDPKTSPLTARSIYALNAIESIILSIAREETEKERELWESIMGFSSWKVAKLGSW